MRPQKEHEIGEWLSSLRNTCHQTALTGRPSGVGNAPCTNACKSHRSACWTHGRATRKHARPLNHAALRCAEAKGNATLTGHKILDNPELED